MQFYGKNYFGFQKNGDKNTIQLAVETSLYKLFNKDIKISGCSRTDAGVSAYKYYFTFDAETKLPADRVSFKLNRYLPKDIQCQFSKEVDINFNVRNEILSKTYLYTIYCGEHIQPLINRFAVYVDESLDIKNMKKCANVLIGQHNFKSFCNYNPDLKTYVRTIKNIKIEKNNEIIKIYITADGFLYNMARILAGTLIECGKNNLNDKDILNLLEIKSRENNIAKTLTSKGLMLYDVEFKNKV